MKIGIFGGTFDPIHKGHVNLAKAYLNNLNLDKLIVIPQNIPPHKKAPNLLNKIDRYNMCRIAFNKVKNVEVSDIEIRQEGAVWTVDTLKSLKKIYVDAEFYLIIGGDLLKTFRSWKDYKFLLENVTICAGARTALEKKSLIEVKKDLLKDGAKIVLLDVEVMEISSTTIRRELKEKKDYKVFLDKNVLEYIETLGLYTLDRNHVEKYEIVMYEMLVSKRRKDHSINVAKEAVTLAINNGENAKKAYIAGVLHDVLKETDIDDILKWAGYSDIISGSDIYPFRNIWHGYFGAKYVEDNFKELDKDIINMIRYHPTSRSNSSLLEKIIYQADLIEFNRDYKSVDFLRDLTNDDFIEGYKYAVIDRLFHLLEMKMAISPLGIYAYNEAIKL